MCPFYRGVPKHLPASSNSGLKSLAAVNTVFTFLRIVLILGSIRRSHERALGPAHQDEAPGQNFHAEGGDEREEPDTGEAEGALRLRVRPVPWARGGEGGGRVGGGGS